MMWRPPFPPIEWCADHFKKHRRKTIKIHALEKPVYPRQEEVNLHPSAAAATSSSLSLNMHSGFFHHQFINTHTQKYEMTIWYFIDGLDTCDTVQLSLTLWLVFRFCVWMWQIQWKIYCSLTNEGKTKEISIDCTKI